MSAIRQLTLEILSGPLDGATFTLTEETAWTRVGVGTLAFPWDEDLGAPQASFRPDGEGWTLQGAKSPHGTYRVNTETRITTGTLRLAEGDILRASRTWLAAVSVGREA